MRRNNMLSRIGSARRAKLAAYGAKDKDVEKAEKFQHGGRIKRAAGGRTEKQVDMAGNRPIARLDRAPRSLGGSNASSAAGSPGAGPGPGPGATASSAAEGPAGVGTTDPAGMGGNINDMADAVVNNAAIASAYGLGLGYGAVGPEATLATPDPAMTVTAADLADAMGELGGVVGGGDDPGDSGEGSDPGGGGGGEGGEGGGDGGDGGGEWRGGRTEKRAHFSLGGVGSSGIGGGGLGGPSGPGPGSTTTSADPGTDVSDGIAGGGQAGPPSDDASVGGFGGFGGGVGGPGPGSDGYGGEGGEGGGDEGGGDGGGGEGGGEGGGGEWRGGRTSRNRRR